MVTRVTTTAFCR